MINTSVILKSKTYGVDTIGNQTETVTNIEVPILRIKPVYANEFYKASQAGFRITFCPVISALCYNEETELEYNGKKYTIVRMDQANQDEVALMCQPKLNEN